uniref:C2H2-type domain-containing protein n=1 Tax=Onchocerca volvulus TaxID=6282 RepID=A0A8R1XLR3_ONCVO
MRRTEVSELYCKKTPRIISRGRLRPANDSAEKGKGIVENDCEMDEVGEEFVVRDGVMMRIADLNKEQWRPMKRFYIDVNRSQIYERDQARNEISLNEESSSSHVSVEVSALPGDGRMFHVYDNLPGVANEVESYPCRYCPNRIFLTSFGLKRHTEMEHQKHLPEVMEEISRIHNEWRRREAFKAIAKKRREALKKTRMLTEVVRRSQSLRSEDRSVDRHYTSTLNCHICGLSFEANYEFMMNHFRAHRKNDDLKRRLITNFGPSYVARCTCRECRLVFVNEKNLMLHKQSLHPRKRKYVCKWCGDVCLSVNELNMHKKNVHGVLCSRSEKSPVINIDSNLQKNTTRLDIIAADDNSSETQILSERISAESSTGNYPSILNQNPCIAKCSECGLIIVKPSLLIRHMQRVHNKNCFSAVIEVNGLPNIRVDMDRGKVIWWCCNFSFEDKNRFIHHRKTCHQPVFIYNDLQSYPVNTREKRIPVHERNDRGFMSADQLINPDETQDDELYILMADEDSEQRSETLLQEMQTDESIVEDAQQITLTAREFTQLRQQIGEDIDGDMQIFLVDDVNDAEQLPSNSGMDPAVDFIANNVIENDILNSLLVSSTQIPSSDDKYYSGAHSSESEFSIVNVPDPTEDKVLQNDLSLPSENLINVEPSSASLSIPTVTFSHDSLVNNSLNCDFQVQGNASNELTIPTVASSNNEQHFHSNVACSPTLLCPDLEELQDQR